MEDVRCDRCGATGISPTALDPMGREEVASLIRGGPLIDAIRRSRELTSVGLRHARAVVPHVTRTPGHCHRCGMSLAVSGVDAVCPRCRSLNHDE